MRGKMEPDGKGEASMQPPTEKRRGHRSLTDWMARAAVALFFLVPGIEKFPSTPGSPWVEMFEQIGWGQWFRVFTGLVEVVGAALFLIPRLVWLGAILLIAAMLGAIAAHVFVLSDPFSSIIPGGLIVVILGVYWKSRSEPGDEAIELHLDDVSRK